MLQRLIREAQPPKSRVDAVTRSMFDTTSIAFDAAASALLTVGMAIWRLTISKGKPKTWPLWGLAVVPGTMLIRGITAAVTGKAHGQESSQRMLAALAAESGVLPQPAGGVQAAQPSASSQETPQTQSPSAGDGNPIAALGQPAPDAPTPEQQQMAVKSSPNLSVSA